MGRCDLDLIRRFHPPDLIEQVLEAARGMVTGSAAAAGFEGIGDLGDTAQSELLDLAAQVRFGHRETVADNAAFILIAVGQLRQQLGQVHASLARPVCDGLLQSFGAHHRTVDLLLGQTIKEIDQVLVGYLQSLDRSFPLFFQEGAECFRSGDRRGTAKGQVAGLGDYVAGGIGRVALDAKAEAQGVSADDRAMFAETVGVLQLTHVGTGFTLDGVHEQLEDLVTIIPGHSLLPSLEL